MNKPTQKQMEVQIMGQSYLLSCPVGGEASLLDAVARVDTAMCRIRDAAKVKARDRIAVLASLNLAFELSQIESRRELAPTGSEPSPGPSDATSASSPVNSAATDPQEQVRLDDLLQRLDQALGTDGRLL
jgi:cell division protein ZapA